MPNVPTNGLTTLNPFSPGFGQVPGSLVGRDELLADLGQGFANGPADERFTTILLGVRGSGKTVALTEVEDRAAANGWIILSVDASTKGLLDRLSNSIYQASQDYESLDLSDLGNSRSNKRSKQFKVGPYQEGWSEQEHIDPNANLGLREKLTSLAKKAQQIGIAVLLTIDELHAVDREEGRRIANDLQHITKRSALPLAFVGAGLLEMQYTVMTDKRNTFFGRCHRHIMPPLSYADAYKGIRYPILNANGTIADEALKLAARSVGDLPYTLQVVGHTAWTLADAPKREIGESAVREALVIAENTVRKNISEPAFYELSDKEQEYLAAIVSLGGRGTPNSIADKLEVPNRSAHNIGRRLRLAGYIGRDSSGKVMLTGLVPAEVVIQEVFAAEVDPDDSPPPNVFLDASPLNVSINMGEPKLITSSRCRKWMPRAKAYCVLAPDHYGRCRSR